MAYQPLYGSITDNAGGYAHSLVLRGKVDEVGFSLNSQLGHVMTVHASGGEYLSNYDRINDCEEKIRQWEDNPARLAVWEAKLKQAKEEEEQLKRENRVSVNITLDEPETRGAEFHFNLNGIRFTAADLKLLQYYHQKDFLGGLAIASAFALIPDISELAENPTAENREAFTEKRDKLMAFFEKEERELKAEYCGVNEEREQ